MTTATATSPLETFQHGRDNFLAVVLDGVSGLETSVLEFMHQHERAARATGAVLADALREKERLEGQLGEQALELEVSRAHVCPVPDAGEAVAGDAEVEPAPVAVDNDGSDDSARIIADLRAALESEQGISAGLRAQLEAETNVSAGLRAEIGDLDDALDAVEGKLRAANEAHDRHVRESRETFDQRLSEGVRAAETGVRGEAVRIIEAIAADNPALAEAADLFTVAFPAEAAPQAVAPKEAPAPAEEPQEDAAAPVVAEAAAAPQPAAEPDWERAADAPAPTAEDFFNALPASAPEDAAEPLTQPLLAAPDLGDDAILDPNFFDNPEPLEAPAAEEAPAAAQEKPADVPKPGYGLFGRKKEAQNV